MTGFELLKALDEHETISVPPVIVYTGKELTREENETLQKYTNTIIIKGVKSEERLLDETALFLHRVVDNMPQRQKKMITNLHDKDSLFTDKKILVVDDDMRNVFALSKILTGKGMKVSKAVNGKMALEVIEKEGNFDLVLLDIMMPEMDGYETTKRLREMPKFRNLPVIALTAKAMKDDRQKCIDAGANDYLAKPVNVDKLLSLMRVWLYR
jgi:CheY-like chemotaxis protein